MTITRIQTTTVNNGAGATTIPITLGAAPTNGNFLVMGIVTAGSATGQVTSITQTGATWVRATEVAKPNVTLEIWYAENVSGASTSVTVNLASSLRGIAAIAEYSGIVTSSSLDKTAINSGDYGGGE